MNLPNRITMTRILIVPLFLLFVIPFPDTLLDVSFLQFLKPQFLAVRSFIVKYGSYIAAAIFILASSTDGVDGYIARKRKLVTNLGKFLDPIADKLLVTAALVALVQRNELTSWAAIIIIARDLLVTGLRLIAAGEGIVVAASVWGKIKTAAQMVAIVAMLLNNFPLSLFTDFPFDEVAMFFAVIITIYSGIDYFRKNKHVLATEE